jgi:hypothetical protein
VVQSVRTDPSNDEEWVVVLSRANQTGRVSLWEEGKGRLRLKYSETIHSVP